MPVTSSHTEDAIEGMITEWSTVFPTQDMKSLRVVSRMLRINRLFEADRERVLKAVDLEPWSFDTLAVLRRQPDSQATPGELMAAALVTSGTITARLKSLESRGWIQRSTDPHDRRQVRVALTVPGRELFDRVFSDVLACQQRLTAVLSGPEAQELGETLRRMLLRLEPTP